MDPDNEVVATEESSPFREELERQFEEAGSDDTLTPEPQAAAEPEVKATPAEGEKPGDNPAQDAQDTADLERAAAAGRAIPERLKAKWGATWDKIDPAVREQFHAYESDIGRLSSKYGKAAKSWEETLKVYAPYEAIVKEEGGNFHGALANLFETGRLLRKGTPEQKAHLLRQIATTFNIPFPDGTQPQAGPSDELVNRLNAFERQALTSQAELEHTTRERVNSEVEAFIGDPKNIYLQEPGYLETMQKLIRSGAAADLKSAYEQAAWLHDRTRQLEIAKANQNRVKGVVGQANRARQAAVSVNGNSPGPVKRDQSQMSLRETLSAAYDGDLD